jgi:formiminotetrahydrofolate cyclodeaminase
MLWLRKKPPVVDQTEELTTRKAANKNAVADAVNATVKLNRVFETDRFTVKIAAAMGAQQETREVKHGH